MRNLRLKWAWQPGSMNLGPQQPPVRTPFPRCPPQPAMAPTVTGSSTPVLSHLNTLIVDMRPTVHGHLSPPGVPQPQLRLMGSGGFRSHHQNPPVEPCAVLPRTAYCVPPVCSVTSLVAHQVPLSMGFSRQEYWSGLSFSPSGDLPHPGTKPSISCLGRRHCQILETALCSGKIPALSPCEDPMRHQERGSVSQLVRGTASFAYRENWVRFRLDGSKRNSVMRQKPAGAPGSPG